jgi:hypothetical protein
MSSAFAFGFAQIISGSAIFARKMAPSERRLVLSGDTLGRPPKRQYKTYLIRNKDTGHVKIAELQQP